MTTWRGVVVGVLVLLYGAIAFTLGFELAGLQGSERITETPRYYSTIEDSDVERAREIARHAGQALEHIRNCEDCRRLFCAEAP